MSTLQGTTGLQDRIGSRLGTIMLALSVLCAIGVAVLILVPSGHQARKPTPSISAGHAQAAPVAHAGPVPPVAVATPVPAGSFRDPATHAILRPKAAPVAPPTLTNPAPAGSFRDPATHALLRVRTTTSGGAPLPANHSLGRIIQ